MRNDLVPSGEIISLTLAFWRRLLGRRTPRSLGVLSELVFGYETYTNYRPERLTRAGRLCARLLADADRRAVRRLENAPRDANYLRRCERIARRLARGRCRYPWPTARTCDGDQVIYTLTFLPERLHGPHAELLGTLLRHKYLVAGRNGTALLCSPRWFHELLTGLWTETCWGNLHEQTDTSLAGVRAEAERSGLGRGHPCTGIGMGEVAGLWDPDPLQTFFDVDEVVATLERL